MLPASVIQHDAVIGNARRQKAVCAAGSDSRCAVADRKVLMLCAAFPPTGGPGVQRSAKFAKYLGDSGWRPIVWATDHVPDLPRDESLLRDLPENLDVRRQVHRDARTMMRRFQDEARSEPRSVMRRLQSGVAWRVERFLTSLAWKTPPDPLIGWALRSRRACLDLIEREGIDVIYSTFSPPSNHVLGWLLRRATGLPWVADFRDLWTADYAYPFKGFRRRLDRYLERLFISDADAVIGVTRSQTEMLARIAGSDRSKFTTITNGFDPDDFAGLDRQAIRSRLHGPDDRFVLAFTGWFLSDRVRDELVEGLTRFAARRRSGFELRIVGAISKTMLRRLTDAGVCVNATGYLPHDRAIEQMVAADALLLPIPPGPSGNTLLPAKTFEYLAARQPILAVGVQETSEAGRIVRECNAGICVDADPNTIEAALVGLWNQWEQGRLPEGCSPRQLARYARDHLTSELAQVLNGIIRANRTPT